MRKSPTARCARSDLFVVGLDTLRDADALHRLQDRRRPIVPNTYLEAALVRFTARNKSSIASSAHRPIADWLSTVANQFVGLARGATGQIVDNRFRCHGVLLSS
jgi:hypothetical protein